uniref:Uncharacterized protein LOC113788999 n=1 Tax=Dermatophagoides pteronyssinus TaxID=6956 RepID=A0A6P6XND1_DERPT
MKRLNLVILMLIMIIIEFDLIIMKKTSSLPTNDNDDDDDGDGEELIFTETEIDHQRNARMLMKQNSNDSCGGENWFQFKNKCYLFHHDLSGASFHEAINICERYHHAHLLQIESIDENKFLQTYLFEKLQLKFSIWLGLIRINVTNFLWLYNRHPLYRLNDNQSTVKTIVDDNDNHHDQWSSYTNWAPNEPNNLDSKHYCVVMSSEKSKLLFGHWYDVECSKVFLVVCERNNHNQDFSNENDTIFNFLTNQNDDDHHHHQIDTSINSNDIHRLIHLLSINLFIWIILFIIIAIWFF